ncbi:unnamed protein product, partial [Amoebophrya sp. A25]
ALGLGRIPSAAAYMIPVVEVPVGVATDGIAIPTPLNQMTYWQAASGGVWRMRRFRGRPRAGTKQEIFKPEKTSFLDEDGQVVRTSGSALERRRKRHEVDTLAQRTKADEEGPRPRLGSTTKSETRFPSSSSAQRTR